MIRDDIEREMASITLEPGMHVAYFVAIHDSGIGSSLAEIIEVHDTQTLTLRTKAGRLVERCQREDGPSRHNTWKPIF